MMQINPYLSFNGNCKEAMEFYKSCLGGELTLMTVAGSAMEKDMPDKKDQIMHSVLKSKDMVLMAADMLMGDAPTQGTAMTLCVSGGSLDELQGYFDKLSEGGNVTTKLAETFFGYYGELVDKHGFRWMFQANKEEK